MGMGRVGQVLGPLGLGALVNWGVGIGGIFYAAALPCFVGAVFVLLLKYARVADAEVVLPGQARAASS
jgi:hypothetical protein